MSIIERLSRGVRLLAWLPFSLSFSLPVSFSPALFHLPLEIITSIFIRRNVPLAKLFNFCREHCTRDRTSNFILCALALRLSLALFIFRLHGTYRSANFHTSLDSIIHSLTLKLEKVLIFYTVILYSCSTQEIKICLRSQSKKIFKYFKLFMKKI